MPKLKTEGEHHMKSLIKKAQWHLLQLLPLTYRSHYRDASNHKRFCVWKMWLGRVYAVDEFRVV